MSFSWQNIYTIFILKVIGCNCCLNFILIPFKILKIFRLIFGRSAKKKNPRSKWSVVPKNLGITALECWLGENVSHPTLLNPLQNSFMLFKFLPCTPNKHHVCSMVRTKILIKLPEEYSTLLSGTASATSLL
jgi:hypothetical protein